MRVTTRERPRNHGDEERLERGTKPAQGRRITIYELLIQYEFLASIDF